MATNDFLKENLSEKITTKFVEIDRPFIAEHEYFIAYADFERTVLSVLFVSFLVLTAGIII